jgi:glycyl-tRNA synthetase
MAEKEPKEQGEQREQGLADKVVNLCVRRGVIIPNSEIYGSIAGFFDYGPVGVALKRNIENSWWHHFVETRDDVVGIDGAIITHPMVWKASGHVDAFNDLLVECSKCRKRFRADHLIESVLNVEVDGMNADKIQEVIRERHVVCPDCKSELKPISPFNLMFKTHVGAVEDDSSVAYLRPETAQLIFADFKYVALAARKQLPFGMAQIGKAFRNEISPRNFIFRCREFSQMEIEFFVHPARLNECPVLDEQRLDLSVQLLTAGDQEKKCPHTAMKIREALEKGIIGTAWHAYWLAECLRWYHSIGIKPSNLRLRQHLRDELSHYSNETWDVEYNYPWGWKELMGVANRSDFDLKQHAKFSSQDLTVLDPMTNEKIVPWVIEPSFGVERVLFTALLDAFVEKEEKGEKKTVLALNPRIAPIKAAVFPLLSKGGLPEKAREVYAALKEKFVCLYDEGGSIGRRYARVDEIGCPFAVTVDYQTMEDGTVTLRDRDTTRQTRVPIAELNETLEKSLG